MRTPVFELLLTIVTRLPYLLVLAAGLVLAIVRRRRAPKAMKLVAIGCAVLLFNHIASHVVIAVFQRYVDAKSIITYLDWQWLISTLLWVGGTVLILLGAFAERVKVEERGFAVVFDSPSAGSSGDASGRTDA